MAIKRILLPMDFSEPAEHAAVFARRLAEACGATLHVLHVAQPVEVALPAPEVGVLLRKLPPDLNYFKKMLDEFLERRLADLHVPVVATVLTGRPWQTIARYAVDSRTDLVVIGAPRRSLTRRLLWRSEAGSILKHAPCPVLVVPHTAAVREPAGDFQIDDVSSVMVSAAQAAC